MLAGCVRTLQPVLKDDQVAPIDKSLLGKWVSAAGDESVDVQLSDKDGTYSALYTDKDGKKGTLLIRMGKVGDLTLAELTPDDPAPSASAIVKYHLVPVYSFLVVRQTGPQFVFATMGEDWLKKYLDQHPNELQTVSRDNSVIVSSATADIQAFLVRHQKDEGALNEASFVRAGDPTTQPAAPPR